MWTWLKNNMAINIDKAIKVRSAGYSYALSKMPNPCTIYFIPISYFISITLFECFKIN